MKLCRIILADDHTLVRQDIKRILAKNPDLEIIGEAVDGRETLELARPPGTTLPSSFILVKITCIHATFEPSPS